MKTQILQLETHDDVISILDKIGWAQTERILLVLPRRRRILHHKLDLLRLKRHTQSRGCQFALVTDDPLIRDLAREVAIPIFPSVQKAHQTEWQTDKQTASTTALNPPFPRPAINEQIGTIQEIRSGLSKPLPIWIKILSFTLAIGAVLVLLLVLSHGAVLQIKPFSQDQWISYPIIATTRVQQARLSGEVPISTRSVTLSGTKTVRVSGSITLPKDFAHGEVLLTNLSDQPIEVPAGTIVRTLDPQPRRYATQETILLQSGAQKSQTVKVQALEGGSAHNALAHEIQAVEGLLGAKIRVENPQPILGGSEMIAPAPSEQDRKRLSQRLQAELITLAKGEILQEIQEGDLLLPDSSIQTRVIRQHYSPEGFTATDFLSLELEIEVTFRVVPVQSLQDLGAQILDSSLPNGFTPVSNTFSATCLEPFQPLENGDYRCPGKLSRRVRVEIDPDQARSLIVGKSLATASQRLQQTYPLSEPPSITIFPNWLPFLPWLPTRIQINIEP